jgi:hypothetical protein
MKWRILLFVCILCSCKKSASDDIQIIDLQKTIAGKWRLIQYYREMSNGVGEWLPTDTTNVQTVQFSPDGVFTHNPNFVVQESIDRYKFLEPHKVLLYSSKSQDSALYFYLQPGTRELIFNPLCIEFSCMRKFERTE